jgi:hypothetical protein
LVAQQRQRVRVPLARVGIGLGRAAALDPVHHLELRLAHAEGPATEVELLPGLQPADPQVAPEPPRVHRVARLGQRVEGRKAQDRDRRKVAVGHPFLGRADQGGRGGALLGPEGRDPVEKRFAFGRRVDLESRPLGMSEGQAVASGLGW